MSTKDIEHEEEGTAKSEAFEDIELGKQTTDTDTANGDSNEADPRRLILWISAFYVLVLILTFSIPFIIWSQCESSCSSIDGYDRLVGGVVTLMTLGAFSFLIAFVNLVLTICRWAHLGLGSKIVGILPAVISVGFIISNFTGARFV